MRLQDSVYGSIKIRDQVLLDLLNAPAVRRLHGVLQHGISALIGITEPITRYEHSVGVMILIRMFGGSLEEQIAGMLHDISHTAFSHVIDYVVGGHHQQSYHDEMKESYVERTELPLILERHGYDWRELIREDAYPLLEQPAPRLCADRLDYFLRDSVGLRLATRAWVRQAVKAVTVLDGRMMMTDPATARWMAYTYIAADDMSWANFREVGLYELAAQAIRRGLEIGIITEADFWGEDASVWARLRSADDPELRRKTALVSPNTRFVWDEQSPTFQVGTKVRTIDPDVVVQGGYAPLSALDEDYARFRDQYMADKRGTWPMRVIPQP